MPHIPITLYNEAFKIFFLLLIIGYLSNGFCQDLKWAKSIGGTQGDEGKAITTDNNGNVYTTGTFVGTVDFDPGTSTFNLTSNGAGTGSDAFINKLDSNGNFVWAINIGDISNNHGMSLELVNNYIYVAGYFQGTPDFDPGIGISTMTAFASDMFIVKLDINGNFIWAKQVGGIGGFCAPKKIKYNNNSLYITGLFRDTLDFDPGPSSFPMNSKSASSTDIFILKLDTNGNFIWSKSFGGFQGDDGNSITIDNAANIYITGRFQSTVDFDPNVGIANLTSNGSYDIFIHKLGQDICSNFSLIIDSASNVSCIDSGDIFTHTNQGLHPISYSWNTIPVTNDSIVVLPSSGIYTLSATDANNCNNSTSLLINGPASMSGFDLNANLIATSFRPVFQSPIYLDAFNDGCDTTSGQLILVLNQLTSFDSASITPNIISGDTLIWNFNALVYNSTHLTPIIYICRYKRCYR